MATRTFITKKNYYRSIDFDIVLLFGLFMTISLISSIFVKYGEYTFGAVVMIALFWSTTEILTPKSKHWSSALIRFIPALLIGAIFGGVLTYYTQFGYYVIQPALSGNMIAVFALTMIIFVSMVITWTAVWAHHHQFVRFK
jgi:hypothetical protein